MIGPREREKKKKPCHLPITNAAAATLHNGRREKKKRWGERGTLREPLLEKGEGGDRMMVPLRTEEEPSLLLPAF